jgi:2,4-dienoyl-CoA reductase-like NADH-dependent reductase (Old Yellow Enzyme family)
MPSRQEAAAARLFSPIVIGPTTLEQRTWVPAMVPWRATEEGYVTDEVIDWYERFARGRGRDRGGRPASATFTAGRCCASV